MTETFSLYVIDEEKLPGEFTGQTDQEVYDQLVRAIEADGVLCGSIELTADDFIDALESIDGHIGGSRFLPNNAFNNSPYSVLGSNGDCPFMGYFSPAQVQEMFALFESLPPDTRDTIDSVYSHGEVFEALFTASEDAMQDSYAVAVVHT